MTTSTRSLWLDAEPRVVYPGQVGNTEVDVVVIGGGIAGLTTALLLKRAGATVAVIEAAEIGSGVTGCNTAKVTALQSTVYSTIRGHHGLEAAATYAEASLAGVEKIAELAAAEEIACELERRPAFTYAPNEAELGAIEDEAEATSGAGLDTVLTDRADLPFEVAGAVRLDDQIAFHPVRYVRGLAGAVDGEGSRVVERTRALSVESGSPCRVHTSGETFSGERVVVATHYPILDRGLFFARLEPQRSYCIAARVGGDLLRGMSISAGQETRSVRAYQDMLIVGGESHPTGSPAAGPERYKALESFARRHWDVEAVTHRWSAQDPTSYDHLPIIGRYTPASSRILVASGFMKWGLSSGTFAAMILSDLVAGRDNAWASRFKPNRVSLRSAPNLARMNAKVGADFVLDRLRRGHGGPEADPPPGEARVVADGLGKKGLYRDKEGGLHAVSLRCSHLGCLLRFNSAEASWDCPCHGSRFDVDGAVLEGPAVRPLDAREP